MKPIFCILFTLIIKLSFAQDTLYYNKENNIVSKNSMFSHYCVISFNKNLNKYLKETYSNDHFLKSQYYYKDAKCDTADGEFIDYYLQSNKLKVKGYLSNNIYNGELTTYWMNGNLRRRDIFEKGEFKEGVCYDSNLNVIPHYDFEIQPKYKNGDNKLIRDIAKNMKYPSEAKKKNIEGKVYTSFVVNKEGKIESIKIVKSIHPLIDEAALETLKKFSQKAVFIPGYREMEAVNVQYNIPLNFKIAN